VFVLMRGEKEMEVRRRASIECTNLIQLSFGLWKG
jgi:hypothetical protein